jgi:hypothetical protein
MNTVPVLRSCRVLTDAMVADIVSRVTDAMRRASSGEEAASVGESSDQLNIAITKALKRYVGAPLADNVEDVLRDVSDILYDAMVFNKVIHQVHLTKPLSAALLRLFYSSLFTYFLSLNLAPSLPSHPSVFHSRSSFILFHSLAQFLFFSPLSLSPLVIVPHSLRSPSFTCHLDSRSPPTRFTLLCLPSSLTLATDPIHSRSSLTVSSLIALH